MTLLQLLAFASIALIISLKVYSVYRKSDQQAQLPSENNPTDWKTGDIQYSYEDIGAGESFAESRLDWGEIFLIVIGLGLCAPFGLILLWKTDRLNSKTKRVITISYVAIVVGFVLLNLGFS